VSLQPVLVLEGRPDDDQKDRLEHFLAELMLITGKYGILLVDGHETTEFHDLPSGKLIGVGLVGFTKPSNPDKILMYVPADSILDGAWLVDTDDGAVPQCEVMNVFPRRDA
jgi:hypothetical protein